jgi:aerobic-type carbon monoxide dehydrogenase small subunit (CoxS/CutS family)
MRTTGFRRFPLAEEKTGCRNQSRLVGDRHPELGSDMATSRATARVALRVNGRDESVLVEPRRTLLDTLRHDLNMTGTKKVCDVGNCGACTVSVDGRAMYSCLLLAVDCDGREVTTIEGVADGNDLDPVQRAFIEEDAFQCGFCTSGQIMSLRTLLDHDPDPSDAAIREAVSGNLCRCGAYANIIAAGHRAAELIRGEAGRREQTELQSGGH